MAEQKTKKSFKNSFGVRTAKVIFGGMASIGAGAVIGALIKNQNLSNLKGLGKFCAGCGITGLCLWVGNESNNAISQHIDDIATAADLAADIYEGATTLDDVLDAVEDDDVDEVVVTEEELE